MTDVVVKQMPAFKKAYKKLQDEPKRLVNAAIRRIIDDPHLGERKKGDLANVLVYKFKIHHQLMLLAYEWNAQERTLLALGVHENFYRTLKKAR